MVAFHTSMAPSSRSTARRAPIWHVQPRRRSRYQTPGTVYRTPNFLPIRSRTRASVHRWSWYPAASGPAASTDSSTASCWSSSRHRAAGPFDASPAAPPATQACRHRRTDRSLTRSSAAITAAGALFESPGRFQPDLLPASSALGGQPAALRIPHKPCIRQEAAQVSPVDITN